MSDTPRTDAVAKQTESLADTPLAALLRFKLLSHELERELAEAEEKLEEIEKFCEMGVKDYVIGWREACKRILAIVRWK